MTAREIAEREMWDVDPKRRTDMNPAGVAIFLEIRRMNEEAQRNRDGLRRLQKELGK